MREFTHACSKDQSFSRSLHVHVTPVLDVGTLAIQTCFFLNSEQDTIVVLGQLAPEKEKKDSTPVQNVLQSMYRRSNSLLSRFVSGVSCRHCSLDVSLHVTSTYMYMYFEVSSQLCDWIVLTYTAYHG